MINKFLNEVIKVESAGKKGGYIWVKNQFYLQKREELQNSPRRNHYTTPHHDHAHHRTN